MNFGRRYFLGSLPEIVKTKWLFFRKRRLSVFQVLLEFVREHTDQMHGVFATRTT